jgi:hypothetical protein
MELQEGGQIKSGLPLGEDVEVRLDAGWDDVPEDPAYGKYRCSPHCFRGGWEKDRGSCMMLKPMLFLFIIKETGSGIPRELAIKLRRLKVSALI